MRVDGAAAGDRAGSSVVVTPDTTGDDLAEFAVGAPGDDEGGADAGAGYVLFGRTDPNPYPLASLGSNGWKLTGRAGNGLGSDVANLGDLNRDDRADLAFAGRGAAVAFGRADAANVRVSDADFNGYEIRSPDEAQYAAMTVSASEDVDGDLLADMVLANPAADAPSAWLVFGQSRTEDVDLANMPARQGLRLSDPGGQPIRAVDDAGDVTGTGNHDAVLGQPYAGDITRVAAGRVVVARMFDQDSCLDYLPALDREYSVACDEMGVLAVDEDVVRPRSAASAGRPAENTAEATPAQSTNSTDPGPTARAAARPVVGVTDRRRFNWRLDRVLTYGKRNSRGGWAYRGQIHYDSRLSLGHEGGDVNVSGGGSRWSHRIRPVSGDDIMPDLRIKCRIDVSNGGDKSCKPGLEEACVSDIFDDRWYRQPENLPYATDQECGWIGNARAVNWIVRQHYPRNRYFYQLYAAYKPEKPEHGAPVPGGQGFYGLPYFGGRSQTHRFNCGQIPGQSANSLRCRFETKSRSTKD